MDKTENGDALPVTTAAEAPTEGMTESMSVEQFAQFMIKQDAKAKSAKSEPEKEPEATEEVETEATEKEAEVETTEDQPEATESEQEQSDEEPKAEDDEEVLSQPKTNDPDKLKKWQENVQKRINSVTAKRKEAEAKAAALEAELTALKEQPTRDASTANPIVVPISDPSDETQTALSESELNKLASDSESALNLIESNRRAILRAMAKDEATIQIGNESYQLEDVLALEQKAKRHLEKLIPQRRQFLKAKEQADTQAKGMYPALFDKKSSEYQQFETFARQFPAVNQVPSARLLYGLAMDKLADLKKPKVEAKKVETPKKASADATTTAAAPRARNTGGEKAQLVKQLEKAEKDFSNDRSTDSYARVLSLQHQLKRLT